MKIRSSAFRVSASKHGLRDSRDWFIDSPSKRWFPRPPASEACIAAGRLADAAT